MLPNSEAGFFSYSSRMRQINVHSAEKRTNEKRTVLNGMGSGGEKDSVGSRVRLQGRVVAYGQRA